MLLAMSNKKKLYRLIVKILMVMGEMSFSALNGKETKTQGNITSKKAIARRPCISHFQRMYRGINPMVLFFHSVVPSALRSLGAPSTGVAFAPAALTPPPPVTCRAFGTSLIGGALHGGCVRACLLHGGCVSACGAHFTPACHLPCLWHWILQPLRFLFTPAYHLSFLRH